MKKIAFILLLCFIFTTPLKAEEINFPTLSGQVVDEAGVLTKQQKNELTQRLSQDKNNQIVAAIIQNLQGMEGREYGIELARRWQIGQKGKDNGVLILIATEDRYVGIEVGYGLEGILPDSLTGRIIREYMLPPLKKDLNYYQALVNGSSAIMTIISGEQPEEESNDGEDIISIILTLLFIYLILSGKIRGGSGGFGGGSFGGFGGSRFTGGGGSFGGGGAGRRF